MSDEAIRDEYTDEAVEQMSKNQLVEGIRNCRQQWHEDSARVRDENVSLKSQVATLTAENERLNAAIDEIESRTTQKILTLTAENEMLRKTLNARPMPGAGVPYSPSVGDPATTPAQEGE